MERFVRKRREESKCSCGADKLDNELVKYPENTLWVDEILAAGAKLN